MMAFRLRLIVALYIEYQKISTKFRLFLFRFSIYHIYISRSYMYV